MKIIRTIARTVARPAPEAGVHFHLGSSGAYVCDNPHCESPGLDPRDLA